MSKVRLFLVGGGAAMVAFFGMAAASMASATYDITPVTTGVTTELVANLPIILGAVGALIALSLAVRAVRKFVKV